MLLQKLVEYSERLDLPPTLYRELPVRYIIDLDADGGFVNIIDTADPSSPHTRRGQLRQAPEVVKSSNIKPLLLCDKADYVLGYVEKDGKPKRVEDCHRAFIELTRRCYAATEEPAVGAVLTFLTDDPLRIAKLPEDFVPADRITFNVDGVFPIALSSVQTFWATENDPARAGAKVMQCVVCGEERPVLGRLQEKLKGVPGGQTAGTSIISANAEAFESYGLEASLIAPTCARCAERFTKAANDLLGKRESSTRVADAAFVYWTREKIEFDVMAMFTEPAADENSALFETIWSGRPLPDIDPVRFCATVFTGSGGRAVVRDWIDTTIGEVARHLRTWFRRQAVVDAYGEAPRPLGLTALAGATARELRDVPRPMARSLLRGALTGQPLPMDLLYQAVRRNRAEQTVTRPRAALIKLVGASRALDNYEEEKLIQLDIENENAAYRCGRLLAVLEEAQRLAIPGVSATIIDRYFGTASSTPASVFPRLVRGAQPHLAKLERDRRGAAIALQRRVEEILGGLGLKKVGGLYTGFPKTLSLQEQGLFSLGYYHQRAHDRAQASAARARRAAGAASEPDADLADAIDSAETADSNQGS